MSVIAISRGSLSATQKFAEGLSAKLGNKIVSREDVFEAAAKYGIKDTALGDKAIFAQKTPGFWDRYSDKRRQYLACFKTALLDFAMKDSIIYHGHLAHVLLTEIPFVLRIRVDAPLENRISSLMEEQNISSEDAAEKIKDIDQRRMKWAQFLYDVDSRDYMNYDIVINLEKMDIKTGIEVVAAAANANEFQANSETMKILNDIYMASVIQTHLMASPRTHGMELDISADSSTGKVKIYGRLPLVGSHTWESDIRATLKNFDSIKEIEISVDEK